MPTCVRQKMRQRRASLAPEKAERPRNCPLSEEKHELLPYALSVRIARRRFSGSGRRTREIVLFTAQTDPAEATAAELFDLSARSWQVELNFDDIQLPCKGIRCQKPQAALHTHNFLQTLRSGARIS